MSLKKFKIIRFLGYLIVARLSCIALANIPIFNMKFIFVYGVVFVLAYIYNYRVPERKESYAFFVLLGYTIFVVAKTTSSSGTFFNTQAFNAYILFFLF